MAKVGQVSEKYTTPHDCAAQNWKFAGTNRASASGTSIALTVVAWTAMPGPPHDGHARRVFVSCGGEQHSIMPGLSRLKCASESRGG